VQAGVIGRRNDGDDMQGMIESGVFGLVTVSAECVRGRLFGAYLECSRRDMTEPRCSSAAE
jgi:hypothetical protein